MRDIYHDELDDIGKTLEAMTQLVQEAMERATRALLDGDLAGPSGSSPRTPHIDALREELNDRTFQIIARQQPVATDLRVLIATTAPGGRSGADGRPGAACRQDRPDAVPGDAVPEEAPRRHLADGVVALSLVGKVGEVIKGRDVALAQAIEAEDDSMDALHRKLFTLLLSPQLVPRHRVGDRHDAARPLLRALRRPRGRRGPPGRLHRHRQDARATGQRRRITQFSG